MKRRITFSTHTFANKVLSLPGNWSCCELVNMLYGRDPGGLRKLGPRHVACWLRRQYLDGDVLSFYADYRGGHALSLRCEADDGTPRHARRKAMAERLLAKPDRRASITVYL